MQRITAADRSARVRQQIGQLRQRIESPQVISWEQVAEALRSLLAELEVAETDRARQHHELTLAREALMVERHRYRELFELAPIGYLVTDISGVVIEANPAASTMLRCSRKALKGKPLPALLQFKDRQSFRRLLQELRSQSGPRETELVLKGRTSLPRWIILAAHRDEDRPGQAPRLRWVLRDVTAQREAEEALQTSRDQG